MQARGHGAGISVVIFGIVVLTIIVVIRQPDVDVPSTPPAGPRPPAISQPSERVRPTPTSLESRDRGPITAPERASPPKTTPVVPKPAASAEIRDRQRVADQELLATPPPIAPALPEAPPEAKKPIEAIEPDALRTAPAPEPAESAPPDSVFEKESLALTQVLGHYEQAYDRLDANGAAAIWPSVDSRALARAFARLRVQDLDLGDCTFVVSATDATARCAGVLHYARRIGDTTPKTEQHVWTIEFVRTGDAWRIVRVNAR